MWHTRCHAPHAAQLDCVLHCIVQVLVKGPEFVAFTPQEVAEWLPRLLECVAVNIGIQKVEEAQKVILTECLDGSGVQMREDSCTPGSCDQRNV